MFWKWCNARQNTALWWWKAVPVCRIMLNRTAPLPDSNLCWILGVFVISQWTICEICKSGIKIMKHAKNLLRWFTYILLHFDLTFWDFDLTIDRHGCSDYVFRCPPRNCCAAMPWHWSDSRFWQFSSLCQSFVKFWKVLFGFGDLRWFTSRRRAKKVPLTAAGAFGDAPRCMVRTEEWCNTSEVCSERTKWALWF